jgi:hypothetical protein
MCLTPKPWLKFAKNWGSNERVIIQTNVTKINVHYDRLAADSYLPHALHECQSILIDLFRIWEKVAPDPGGRGQRWKRSAKSFDHEPAVVFDFVQILEDFVPGHLTGSRRTAIILADVHMSQHRSNLLDSAALTLFLDMGVKGVIHCAEIRMINAIHKVHGVGRSG